MVTLVPSETLKKTQPQAELSSVTPNNTGNNITELKKNN